jgi:hypothetical protein
LHPIKKIISKRYSARHIQDEVLKNLKMTPKVLGSLQYLATKSSGACQTLDTGLLCGIDISRIRDGACPIPYTFCDILGLE